MEYRHRCTVMKDLPYQASDGPERGPQPSVGTLHVGRVVWLDHDLVERSGKVEIRAYAEGIGLVTVDPGALSASC